MADIGGHVCLFFLFTKDIETCGVTYLAALLSFFFINVENRKWLFI